MTKNKEPLVWRLKEKPSAEGVASLVEQKIITPEEGREILFNKSDSREKEQRLTDKVSALQEEVEFLRELSDKLASKTSNGWTYVYNSVNDYKPSYAGWRHNYLTCMGDTTVTTTGTVYFNDSTTGTTSSSFAEAMQGSSTLLSKLNTNKKKN